MLNLKEIAQRIKNPQLCTSADIPSLKTLCDTHPYAQIFPLLYLQTLAKNKDIRLDAELQKYAYRIADRSVLFDLLHVYEVEASTVVAEDSKENAQKEPTPLPSLPDEVLKSLGIGQQTYVIDSMTSKQLLSTQEEEKPEKMSFFDWVDRNSILTNDHQLIEPQTHPRKTPTNDLIERFIKNEPRISSLGAQQINNERASSHSFEQAIQSIDDSTLPISETLAKIFVAQGNYPRAIATYQQLSLHNPEKKRFFAEKIEELSQKIDSAEQRNSL